MCPALCFAKKPSWALSAGWLGALLVLLTIGWPALCATGGSITGLVEDATGGVMADVAVIARNSETAAEHTTVSNTTGFYAFPILPSGSYELRIEHPGFKPHRL